MSHVPFTFDDFLSNQSPGDKEAILLNKSTIASTIAEMPKLDPPVYPPGTTAEDIRASARDQYRMVLQHEEAAMRDIMDYIYKTMADKKPLIFPVSEAMPCWMLGIFTGLFPDCQFPVNFMPGSKYHVCHSKCASAVLPSYIQSYYQGVNLMRSSPMQIAALPGDFDSDDDSSGTDSFKALRFDYVRGSSEELD